jgi:hypothetical protein
VLFGSKREEVTGDWKILNIEELHDLCSSPNIIPVVILRRARRGRACGMYGEEKNAHRALVGKHEEIDYFEDVGLAGRITWKWIL